MCVVSAIGDDFHRRWEPRLPKPWEVPAIPMPIYPDPAPFRPYDEKDAQKELEKFKDLLNPKPVISKEDFDQLKKEVEALKDALKYAKIYDEATGAKDCEMEEKIAFLKKIAEMVGVDLSEVFGKKPRGKRTKAG